MFSRLNRDVFDPVEGSIELGVGGAGRGELVEREVEHIGELRGDTQRRLVLAVLIAPQLADVDAGRAGQLRLGQTEFLTAASEDRAKAQTVLPDICVRRAPRECALCAASRTASAFSMRSWSSQSADGEWSAV